MMEIKEQLFCEMRKKQKVLVGIGKEWSKEVEHIELAYKNLAKLLEGKDYFIVTTLTDAAIYQYDFDPERITAPCGNVTWWQCEEACTKDIWEDHEVETKRCPHCEAELVENSIQAKQYIEEGYLKSWGIYTNWLASTLNQELLLLELGVGFETPTVVRWPFEKTAYVNDKAYLYRVHETFFQTSPEIKEKSVGIEGNSVELFASRG